MASKKFKKGDRVKVSADHLVVNGKVGTVSGLGNAYDYYVRLDDMADPYPFDEWELEAVKK